MIIVRVDEARKLVRVVMDGWLTVAEVEAFSNEEQHVIQSLGWRSGEFDLLVETHGNLVQSQAVMETFAMLMKHSHSKARKIATVRDGVLTRMQTRRLSKVRTGAEVFDNVADAEAWLSL